MVMCKSKSSDSYWILTAHGQRHSIIDGLVSFHLSSLKPCATIFGMATSSHIYLGLRTVFFHNLACILVFQALISLSLFS